LTLDDDLGLGGIAILGLAAALYAWFASTAQPNRAAVYALRARDYVNAGDEKRVVPLFVGEIDAAEVSAACPAIELVQKLANKAAGDAQTDRTYRSAREYGTAVHFLLKTRIDTMVANGETNLAAEVSYLKSEYADRKIVYGERDSIRIDVFDNTAQDGTVCVYDIKTGDKGLDDRRAAEIMRAVFTRWPKTKRIVVCMATIKMTARIASRTNVTQFSMSDSCCVEAAASSTPAKMS
jgi:hypothetical protein